MGFGVGRTGGIQNDARLGQDIEVRCEGCRIVPAYVVPADFVLSHGYADSVMSDSDDHRNDSNNRPAVGAAARGARAGRTVRGPQYRQVRSLTPSMKMR